MTIKILLVDDHKIARQGCTYLQTLNGIAMVTEAASGTEAIQKADEAYPNVVLMDLEMSGELDGIAVPRQIRTEYPEIQVIEVTSHHQDEYILPAEGEAVLDSRVVSCIIKEFQGIQQDEANPFTELSEREFDVLRLIAAGKSNAEIADALIIGESTVKTHVGNMLKKLHLDDRRQVAVYVWQQGIVRRVC